MSATGLMDHPEQEEPPRTVCANQRPERGKEPAGRRCPRPREPGFAHFVRVLPLIPRKHREGKQRLVAGSPLQDSGEWRRRTDRLSQMLIRHYSAFMIRYVR